MAFALKGHTGSITGVTYSRDGQRIASFSSGEGLNLWDGTPEAAR